jgi:hypothetical protein
VLRRQPMHAADELDGDAGDRQQHIAQVGTSIGFGAGMYPSWSPDARRANGRRNRKSSGS